MELPADLAWLRSFVAVARALSFTRAALALDMRQSTVSEHVRKLEAAVGVRLFVRDTHRVRLTDDGEAMVGFATSILETSRRAVRHFARENLEGLIRFGVSEDMVITGLPHLLRQFVADHPRVVLELTVGLSETLREAFDAGKLDLALLKRPCGDERGEFLWAEPLVWIAAPGFGLASSRPLPLLLLSAPALTRSITLAALERFSSELNREGFTRRRFSDSRSLLAKEAGMDGSSLVA